MDIFRLFFMLVFELAQAFLEKSNGSVVGILTSMMDTTGFAEKMHYEEVCLRANQHETNNSDTSSCSLF